MTIEPSRLGDGELHLGLFQSTAVHLNHHFVPSDWLKREFPKHLELIEMIETRAQSALAETGRPQASAILD